MSSPPADLLRRRRSLTGDRVFTSLAYAVAGLMVVIVAIFVAALFVPALPAIRHYGWSFLTTTVWDPVRLRFGALAPLFGTLLTSLIGMVLAFPIGLGAAIFLAEQSRYTWLRTPLSFLVELLAGIPSVVIGLWALFIMVPLMRDTVDPAVARALGFLPFFRGEASGFGFLTAGVILAIMVLPIMVALSRDVIRSVPRSLIEASLALGATRAESLWSVVLPYARVGISGAVLLSLGRALGETIAVTMVIGNRPEITSSLFAPGYTLASQIANEFTEAVGKLYQGALFELGLLLVVITILVNILARILVWQLRRTNPSMVVL
jgi:phosphate transport system permease protein